jgi:hypothetical protein
VFPKKVPQNGTSTSENIDGFLLMSPYCADGNIPRLLYDVGDIDAERFEKGYKRGSGSHQPIGLRLEAFQGPIVKQFSEETRKRLAVKSKLDDSNKKIKSLQEKVEEQNGEICQLKEKLGLVDCHGVDVIKTAVDFYNHCRKFPGFLQGFHNAYQERELQGQGGPNRPQHSEHQHEAGPSRDRMDNRDQARCARGRDQVDKTPFFWLIKEDNDDEVVKWVREASFTVENLRDLRKEISCESKPLEFEGNKQDQEKIRNRFRNSSTFLAFRVQPHKDIEQCQNKVWPILLFPSDKKNKFLMKDHSNIPLIWDFKEKRGYGPSKYEEIVGSSKSKKWRISLKVKTDDTKTCSIQDLTNLTQDKYDLSDFVANKFDEVTVIGQGPQSNGQDEVIPATQELPVREGVSTQENFGNGTIENNDDDVVLEQGGHANRGDGGGEQVTSPNQDLNPNQIHETFCTEKDVEDLKPNIAASTAHAENLETAAGTPRAPNSTASGNSEDIWQKLGEYSKTPHRVVRGISGENRVVLIHWCALSFRNKKFVSHVMMLIQVSTGQLNFHLFHDFGAGNKPNQIKLDSNQTSLEDLKPITQCDLGRRYLDWFKGSGEKKQQCGNGLYLFYLLFGGKEESTGYRIDNVRPLEIYLPEKYKAEDKASKDKRHVLFVDHSEAKETEKEELKKLGFEISGLSIEKPDRKWSKRIVQKFCTSEEYKSLTPTQEPRVREGVSTQENSGNGHIENNDNDVLLEQGGHANRGDGRGEPVSNPDPHPDEAGTSRRGVNNTDQASILAEEAIYVPDSDSPDQF